MAVNKEIWINDIVKDFWPDNSFLTKSVDHTPFVDGKTVHVPNAGAAVGVTKNATQFPISVTTREDSDQNYNIDKFYSTPVLVQDLEAVELSYDKRNSLMQQCRESLLDAVSEDVLYKWAGNLASGASIATTGENEAAHLPNATSTRKKMTKADVMSVKKLMDKAGVPAEGRYMLLDAVMYDQLVSDLTEAQTVNFLAGADAEQGIVGKYLGFSFLMRSRVLKCNSGSTLSPWSTACVAGSNAAGLAWQQSCVSRAMGSVELFEKEKDPTYYGDVFSLAMRAGGCHFRADKKGVVLIYQGAA